MQPRHRLCLSASLALLACKFDATGLGAGDGPPLASETASETSAATDASADASTDASTTEDAISGSGSGSDGASETGDTDTGGSGACGNGLLEPGEACDDGPGNGASRPCTPACAVNVCGDGYAKNPGEACDDGNDVDDDACRDDCTLPASCGNAQLDRGEACDDGNAVDTDQCIACQKASCGDGFVEANNESCDDGAESATCNLDCSLAVCGDTKLNKAAGEVCDLGPQNGLYDSPCSADCKGEGPHCGDGQLDQPDEKCEPDLPPPESTCAPDCQAITCTEGRGNCDGDLANGCETDLKSDEDHCGECGNECVVVSCKDGVCKL